MKTNLRTTALLALLSTLSSQLSTALAQGTAFTYQGRLNSDGASANGLYDFRFRLAADPLANTYVGNAYLTNAIPVTNGLFITTMDFGPGLFAGSNYWLEVDVRTNGAANYSALTPLQALSPTPYAIFANGAGNLLGVLPAAQLSGALVSGNLPSSPTVSGTVTAGSFTGNGASLTSLNANNLTSGTVPLARLSGITSNQLDATTWQLATNLNGGNAASLNGLGATNFWQTSGNSGTVAGVNYVGTADNQPLEIHVNGQRAFRLEPAGASTYLGNGVPTGAPNVVGGAQINHVAAGVVGATISGGGATNYQGYPDTNSILADLGTIGGGEGNSIQPNAITSTIGGGAGNTILGFYSTIAGGTQNQIQSGSSSSTIAGGYYNLIQPNSSDATISGGQFNEIDAGSFESVIAGGGNGNFNDAYANWIQGNAWDSFIGGGELNLIQTGAHDAVICGGWTNTIQQSSYESFIGGGGQNTIQANAGYATLAGGNANSVGGTYATVPGGYQNAATGSYSFAAGQQAQAANTGAFVWADDSAGAITSTNNNSVTMRAAGGYRLYSNSGATAGVLLAANGTAWSTISDQNAKKNFQAVNGEEILNKLATVPVEKWNYKWEKDTDVPNIGPMAQAFKHAFYPGRDDKSITTLEFDGVELAAIQGLDQKLEEQKAENAELKQQLAELKALVEKLAQQK